MLTHFDSGYRRVYQTPPSDPSQRQSWTHRRAEASALVHSALGLGSSPSRSCDLGMRPLESFFALWGVGPEDPERVALSRAAGVLKPESTVELQDKFGSKLEAARVLQALAKEAWVDRTNRVAVSMDPFMTPAAQPPGQE